MSVFYFFCRAEPVTELWRRLACRRVHYHGRRLAIRPGPLVRLRAVAHQRANVVRAHGRSGRDRWCLGVGIRDGETRLSNDVDGGLRRVLVRRETRRSRSGGEAGYDSQGNGEIFARVHQAAGRRPCYVKVMIGGGGWVNVS